MSQISLFNYREGPKSDLLLRGTPIAALSEGKAEVEYEDGNAKIEIEAKDLPEPASLGPYTSVELLQARYSVAIASAAGAEQYAPEEYAAARQDLEAAELSYDGKRSERKSAPDLARQAVVDGEDARRSAARTAAEVANEAEREAAAAAAATAAAASADLVDRLNRALPTRETERGLVSEIGGVQFETGQSDLGTGARESLARFAGIVASYPNLDFSVEGHTDNTGNAQTNQELPMARAAAVREFLISQGVQGSRINVAGYGSLTCPGIFGPIDS
jgi:outer membrane protein OmpA-like peptidoglycan-associated protein